jgi:methylated-DNA-[protein]-cysteine S-methyltransferase
MIMEPSETEPRVRAEPARKPLVYRHTATPVGKLLLAASDAGLALVLWENVLVEAERQLEEYFAGRRRRFDRTLDFSGTPFQREVWNALLTIPYGETRSYAQIARQIGHPTAVRAVGAANGRNPISIIAPCHRVIGSSGALTGFAAGLDIKAKLLTHEGTLTGWILDSGD